MNKSFFIINLVLLACLLSCALDKKKENPVSNIKIQNPLDVAFGDPFILKASDGKYLMASIYR